MDLYMGKDSAKDSGWFTRIGPLKANVLRQQGIHFYDPSYSPGYSYVYIYCNHPRAQCQETSVAKTEQWNGLFSNSKYLYICPRFFGLYSLDYVMNIARKEPVVRTVIDIWGGTQAAVIFHETYHWHPEVAIPHTSLDPEVYDAADVVKLAQGPLSTSKLNAQSWALAALATYVMQNFGLPNPPQPFASVPAQGKVAVEPYVSTNGTFSVMLFSDVISDNATSPPDNDPSPVDVNAPGPLPPYLPPGWVQLNASVPTS